ncbi:MAG: hypothetical protein ACTSQJ_06320 [Promethearchaeota archaeon]
MNPEDFKQIKYEKEENGILTVMLKRLERKNAVLYPYVEANISIQMLTFIYNIVFYGFKLNDR